VSIRNALHRQYLTIALAFLALLTAATVAFLFPLLRPIPVAPPLPEHPQPETAYVREPFHQGLSGSQPFRPTVHGSIRLGSPIAGTYVLQKADPVWPQGTSEHLGGDVVVEVVVDREGRVASAKAVYGNPLFYAAVLDAVRQ
jgi:hypothetical protein